VLTRRKKFINININIILSPIRGGSDYRGVGVFEIWAVFRYRLFLGTGYFSIWAVFQIWAILEKSEFCQCTGLSIFGWEVVLGYFAKISILSFFPWHAKNRV
jgi:hypothetical protein